jgi:hypothetical protein
MPFSRRTPLTLSFLVLSGALILAPTLGAQAATTSPTTASVLASATKSLNKETGVHIVVKTVDKKVDSSVVADIGTARDLRFGCRDVHHHGDSEVRLPLWQ